MTLAVSAAGVLIPLVMALGGADYLAPRNLVGAMVPFSALIAVLATWPARRDALGPTLLTVALLALLAVTLTVTFDPKYQRGDWKGVVNDLPAGDQRVMVVNQLGSAPLRYYTPGLEALHSERLRTSARNRDGGRRTAPFLRRRAAGARIQARRQDRLHGAVSHSAFSLPRRRSSACGACAITTSRSCTPTCSRPSSVRTTR